MFTTGLFSPYLYLWPTCDTAEHQATFLGYGREYVERCHLKGHLQTADKYTGHLTRLSQDIDQLPLGNQKDAYLDELTEEWILKWANWLRNNGANSPVTMHRRMGFMSTLFNDARRYGVTKADPMAFLEFKERYVSLS